MKCIQFVKTVLDELYNQIDRFDDDAKDVLIKAKIQYLKREYEDLISKEAHLDYADPVTRFTYIYRYTTSHANMVYHLIKENGALSRLFEKESVNISCLGGGPGSDLLGILKFVELEHKSARLMCKLYDREDVWAEAWEDVAYNLKAACHVNTAFRKLDVIEESVDWEKTHRKVLESDLFTMIFFISEVYYNREDARSFFEYLFENARSRALFLFVDNASQPFYEWFDEFVDAYDLKCLDASDKYNFRIEYGEEKTDLEPYFSKFGSPKLGGKISYRICRKR